jgi:hypothetical protein
VIRSETDVCDSSAAKDVFTCPWKLGLIIGSIVVLIIVIIVVLRWRTGHWFWQSGKSGSHVKNEPFTTPDRAKPYLVTEGMPAWGSYKGVGLPENVMGMSSTGSKGSMNG